MNAHSSSSFPWVECPPHLISIQLLIPFDLIMIWCRKTCKIRLFQKQLEHNHKNKMSEGPPRFEKIEADYVWCPSGPKRTYVFSIANTVNENIRVRKQTFRLVLQIGLQKYMWLPSLQIFPSQNCQMFYMRSCPGSGSTVKWMFQVFFFPPQIFSLCRLPACSVPTLVLQLQTPAEQNECRAHNAHYLWRGEKPRCWHRCVLSNNSEAVCSCDCARVCVGIEYPVETYKLSLYWCLIPDWIGGGIILCRETKRITCPRGLSLFKILYK